MGGHFASNWRLELGITSDNMEIGAASLRAQSQEIRLYTGSKFMVGAMSALSIPAGASSMLASSIRQIYRMGSDANAWVDGHITDLQKSENPSISRTGRVLEKAKEGFAMGYMSSVVIIAAGQFLLGNTGAALASMGTAVVLANPVAMTCAAVGAIFYGWAALSEEEQDQVVANLASGFAMGTEIIRGIIEYVAKLMKKLSEGSWSGSIKEMLSSWGDGLSDFFGDAGEAVVDFKDAIQQKVAAARKRGFSEAPAADGVSSPESAG